MGIDGLTNLNLGLMRELSPVDLLNYVKQEADEQAQKAFKKIENSEKIVLNPDSQNKKEQSFSQDSEEKREKEEKDEDSSVVSSSENNKKYHITCTLNQEYVEIIDSGTNQVVEKITIEQLKKFFAHIKNPSGLLVDKSG